MPPRVKFQKEEIVNAALETVRAKGPESLTAREVAAALGGSTRPIFTWFDSMESLKGEVRALAAERYRGYLERGLRESVPFRGVWRQYLRFAKEEPSLYKLLFLTRPTGASGGAVEALRFSQELARESVMRIYRMDAYTADCFFRDLWLAAFSFATMIVTDECPYTEEEILAIGTEISVSICKAYKEIPGLAAGQYDRDAVFSAVIGGGQTE
ncbi:MAG: TetR/AcrR family transcriptional regulator [Clostridia bacterium]|nr:TetR/AcrR family transcriptional regulator [Clostridia bacterium]